MSTGHVRKWAILEHGSRELASAAEEYDDTTTTKLHPSYQRMMAHTDEQAHHGMRVGLWDSLSTKEYTTNNAARAPAMRSGGPKRLRVAIQ